jgi:hypothetical protein
LFEKSEKTEEDEDNSKHSKCNPNNVILVYAKKKS